METKGNSTEETVGRVLHVGAPNLGDRNIFDSLVDGIFERRWFTNNGQLVQELESRLSEFLGVKHCILVCNATVGLQVASHALKLTGDIIVPAYTFVATAHSLQWERLRPVFADVDPVTHTIDVASAEALITEDTSAIVGVHLWGSPCDTQAIDSLAKQHGLKVMYDAAHAFGCRHLGQRIANFGACEVFSFHATKFFNTFEGGAITTNDDQLAQDVRLTKNFGFAGLDSVVDLGTNGKMPEICAAMGLACFESISEILAANRRNYEIYRDRLGALEGVRVFSYDQHEGPNWQYVVLEIGDDFGPSRDQLLLRLHQHGILARRYFYPGCHRMEPYVTLNAGRSFHLPVTEKLCQSVVCLPTGTATSERDAHRVCDVISNACSACK